MAHLTREPFRDEASTVGIPFIAVKLANPLSLRIAVLADVNGARSVAVVVAAVVILHNNCHSHNTCVSRRPVPFSKPAVLSSSSSPSSRI